MIIPLFTLAFSPLRLPITSFLIVMNVLFLCLMPFLGDEGFDSADKLYKDEAFLKSSGAVFLLDPQFKNQVRTYSEASPYFRELAARAKRGDSEAFQLLTLQFALQDLSPWVQGRKPAAEHPNPVAFFWVKSKVDQLLALQEIHPFFYFGFLKSEAGWREWMTRSLTYQFVHSGFMHMFFNMLFFLIIAAFLEPLMGSLWFCLLYLISGMGGALIYSLFPTSAAPLVGASASVCGLFGAALVILGNRKTVFYFVVKFARMSYWIWFFYFWILFDFAGLIKALPGVSTSVGHWAHLGGTLAGVSVALVFKYFKKDLDFKSADFLLPEERSPGGLYSQ